MSGLKVAPAGEKLPVAAEASARDPRQIDLEDAVAKAHAEAAREAGPQRVTLAMVADLHMEAIARGDTVAAEAYASTMSLVAAMLRVPLIHENRAGEVIQGLRMALGAMRYLEERREARGGREEQKGYMQERMKRAAEVIERQRAEALALARPAPEGDDPLQAEAVNVRDPRGGNSQKRNLTTKEREAEEAAMRDRAKAMQRERDGRHLAAQDERRAEAGIDVADEAAQQQMSDEALQAQIEAQDRLKARMSQRAKNAPLPGGVIGAGNGEELSYEDVVARAQGGPKGA